MCVSVCRCVCVFIYACVYSSGILYNIYMNVTLVTYWSYK